LQIERIFIMANGKYGNEFKQPGGVVMINPISIEEIKQHLIAKNSNIKTQGKLPILVEDKKRAIKTNSSSPNTYIN
jgi:hypothetical protein